MGAAIGSGAILLDMSGMNRVLSLDAEMDSWRSSRNDWVDLVNYLITVQRGAEKQWGIIQKQTGADRLSVGAQYPQHSWSRAQVQTASPRHRVGYDQKYIPQHELEHLIYLAHVDKAQGFRRYAEYYTASSGQIYYNDTHHVRILSLN